MSEKGKSHKAYPPEFKSKCVRELLDGGETLSQVASRNGIAPSVLSKWKSQVLENMDAVFGAEAHGGHRLREVHRVAGTVWYQRHHRVSRGAYRRANNAYTDIAGLPRHETRFVKEVFFLEAFNHKNDILFRRTTRLYILMQSILLVAWAFSY